MVEEEDKTETASETSADETSDASAKSSEISTPPKKKDETPKRSGRLDRKNRRRTKVLSNEGKRKRAEEKELELSKTESPNTSQTTMDPDTSLGSEGAKAEEDSEKTEGTEEDSKEDAGGQVMGDRCYHNPDPLYRLIGPANEALVYLEGRPYKALLDTGAMVSLISETTVEELKLKLWPISKLKLTGPAGKCIPYSGYVETTLEVGKYRGDVLFLVVPETTYSKRVPLCIGTTILGEVLAGLDKEKEDPAWRLARCAKMISEHTVDV